MIEEAPFIIVITREGRNIPDIYSATEYEAEGGYLVFYGTDICDLDVIIAISLSSRTVEITIMNEEEESSTYPVDSYEIRFNKDILGKNRFQGKRGNDQLHFPSKSVKNGKRVIRSTCGSMPTFTPFIREDPDDPYRLPDKRK